MKPKHLIVIGGPTASGKTSFAIQLAKHFNTEIISADSRQLYKELNIGVARPTTEELAQVKHHLIASHSIHSELNAGSYAQQAQELIEQLFRDKDALILVGGTGLYIQAVLDGFDPLPGANPELREELDQLYKKEGIVALQTRLNTIAPDAEVKDPHNPQRLIRAIEIAMGSVNEDAINKGLDHRYAQHKFYLNPDRDSLYDRINERVDHMMEEGLLDEVKGLLPYKDLNALQTVGYKELFAFLEGTYSREFAIDKIKQHSRNYAKRQLTWFKNKGFTPVPSDPHRAFKQVIDLI